MDQLVGWMLLCVSVVITTGLVVVMFLRRSSNVNLRVKGLGLEIDFSARKSATWKKGSTDGTY